MDWSNAEHYEFPPDFAREAWAWEFLRRNPNYQADFVEASSCGDPVYDPPKHAGETDAKWVARVIQEDAEPRKLHPMIGLAMKWGIALMQDPDSDSTPEFLPAFPYLPEWDEVGWLYSRQADEAPITMNPDVAVIAFDVERPFSEQVGLAKRLFLDRQEGETTRRTYLKPTNWPLYLRLLDAKDAGVTTPAIIAAISEYSVLPNDAASSYLATDRVSDHLKRARYLCSNPLSILR